MIQENGLALAYIGDAVYELKVREYLVDKGLYIVNNLHHEAIKYTSANSQALILDELLSNLTDDEVDIYKRGRNASSTHKPKNASLSVYRKATGFEALIGYLYLIKNNERLDFIIDFSINFINKKTLEIAK